MAKVQLDGHDHDADPRPAPQPPRQGRGGAIRQEVGDTPPLQVDQDGPVGAPLLERPIVGPQDAGRRTRRERQAPHEAQHRGGAHRHGQARREPRAGLAAERDPDPRLGLGQPPRAAAAGREQTRQALGEGAPRAVRGAAVEPAHAQAEAGLAAEHGQVGGVAVVAAVHGVTDATALGTAAVIATAMDDDPDRARIDAHHPVDATARRRTELVHGLSPARSGRPRLPHLAAAFPRKVRESRFGGEV